MKLLLIREKYHYFANSTVSYGLGLIGTLSKEIATVRIIDNNSKYKKYSRRDILKAIDKFKPDIIGFNISAFNIFQTKETITEILRVRPEICLIAGGIHSYEKPEEIVALGIHVVTIGDAELTIIPLLKELIRYSSKREKFQLSHQLIKELEQIPGLCFLKTKNNVIERTGNPQLCNNLDDLPFVDFDLFNLDDYLKIDGDHRYITNNIATQRGCPFNCTFCQIGSGVGLREYRENSPEYKIKYLEYLHKKYSNTHFKFHDNNFTLNKKKTFEFCELMVKSGLNKKITYSIITNVALPFDEELLSALKESGCTEMSIGVERLTKTSLELVNKNKDYERMIENISLATKYSFFVQVNCLIGMPFDNPEILAQEKELFIRILHKVNWLATALLVPLPGTKIYKDTDSKKWYLKKKFAYWNPSFYHTVYFYISPAYDENFFNLSPETMQAIRDFKEFFYKLSIKKLNNKLVSVAFAIVQVLARISYITYHISPRLEQIIFAIPKRVRILGWNLFVARLHEAQRNESLYE